MNVVEKSEECRKNVVGAALFVLSQLIAVNPVIPGVLVKSIPLLLFTAKICAEQLVIDVDIGYPDISTVVP
jgi:hypothetical protein